LSGVLQSLILYFKIKLLKRPNIIFSVCFLNNYLYIAKLTLFAAVPLKDLEAKLS